MWAFQFCFLKYFVLILLLLNKMLMKIKSWNHLKMLIAENLQCTKIFVF